MSLKNIFKIVFLMSKLFLNCFYATFKLWLQEVKCFYMYFSLIKLIPIFYEMYIGSKHGIKTQSQLLVLCLKNSHTHMLMMWQI
jgi:hypothetical protein